MRRTLTVGLAAAAVFFGSAVPAHANSAIPAPTNSAVPAQADQATAAGPGSARSATAAGLGGWVPAPTAPFDRAAGVLCDFAIHGEPVVDEVRVKTIATYPDGSPKEQLATGALTIRVTNTETGASTVADASGSALFVFGTDGSSTWYVVGPIVAGFRDNGGNLPRGFYKIDGVYTLAFSPTNVRTLTMIHGTVHDVCADIA